MSEPITMFEIKWNEWSQGKPGVDAEVVTLNIHKTFWNQWASGDFADSIFRSNHLFKAFWEYDYVRVSFVKTALFKAWVDEVAHGTYVKAYSVRVPKRKNRFNKEK